MTETRACPHSAELTRNEAAAHMACTAYGRVVGPRTIDRWANDRLITKVRIDGLQWIRFHRDELTALAAGQTGRVPRGELDGGTAARCQVQARKGKGSGRCGYPLNGDGSCPRVSTHIRN